MPKKRIPLAKEYVERVERMQNELDKGFRFLDRFDDDRVVTIFGSAVIPEGDPVYNQAMALGRMLAEEKITVVTGGGPGVMEAANRGAFEAGGKSIGVNIQLATQERRNRFVKDSVAFRYFFARKIILAHIAQAYVFFPGGFGTLDEFFEIITLISTKKIEEKMPIVLIGKKYWGSLEAWLDRTAIERYKTLQKSKLNLWTVTDSVHEALSIVRKIPTRVKRSKEV